jgi:hypothetical protein
MKLTASQVTAIQKKTGLKPLPDSAASETGLAEAFGDQTFYVDPQGIYVFESIENPSGDGDPVMAIQIASVEPQEEGSEQVTVRAVQPRPIDLTVDLAA